MVVVIVLLVLALVWLVGLTLMLVVLCKFYAEMHDQCVTMQRLLLQLRNTKS